LGSDAPAVVSDLQRIVDLIEPRLVLRAASVSAATSSLGTLQDGMFLITTAAPIELYYRASSTWVKLAPTNYTGTALPASSLGIDGDTYDRYV
jgi:hypothetical protein